MFLCALVVWMWCIVYPAILLLWLCLSSSSKWCFMSRQNVSQPWTVCDTVTLKMSNSPTCARCDRTIISFITLCIHVPDPFTIYTSHTQASNVYIENTGYNYVVIMIAQSIQDCTWIKYVLCCIVYSVWGLYGWLYSLISVCEHTKGLFHWHQISCNSCHRHLSEVALCCFLMKLDGIVRRMMDCYGNW